MKYLIAVVLVIIILGCGILIIAGIGYLIDWIFYEYFDPKFFGDDFGWRLGLTIIYLLIGGLIISLAINFKKDVLDK